MDNDYIFDIGTLLAESQPRSILIIGLHGDEVIADYLEQKRFLNQDCQVRILPPHDALEQLQATDRFDIGIVADTLEHMEKKAAGNLIARLRDLHTARFCVIAPMGDDWSEHRSHWMAADFLGYGMILVNAYTHEDGVRHMYKYDIATYKKTPEWLSAKDWANPELWDKYRW